MVPRHLFQIDLLKAFAIVSVVVMHSVDGVYYASFDSVLDYPFWLALPLFPLTVGLVLVQSLIWQAIPVFLILMGLNMSWSFTRRGYSKLKDTYSKAYFINRFNRIIVPFLMVFAVSLILKYSMANSIGEAVGDLGVLNLLGYLPTQGKGNYFIPILFQFILIFPLLYLLYLKHPKVTLLLSFALSLIHELTMPLIQPTGDMVYVYQASIFRFIAAMALGLWVSDDTRITSKRNRFIIPGFTISFIFLLMYGLLSYRFSLFMGNHSHMNVFSFFYPLVIVLLGIRYLPQKTKSRAVAIIAQIGGASYHIFLVQILFFQHESTDSIFNHLPMPLLITVNIITCVTLGLLFKSVESRVKKIKQC